MATRCRGLLTLSTRRHVSAISSRGDVILKTSARKDNNMERKRQREREEREKEENKHRRKK
jgi:hypothetical protein